MEALDQKVMEAVDQVIEALDQKVMEAVYLN